MTAPRTATFLIATLLVGVVAELGAQGPGTEARRILADSPQVLDSLDRLNRQHPDDAEVWLVYGQALERARYLNRAWSAMERAGELAPEVAVVHLAQARLARFKKNDPELARSSYAEVTRLVGDDQELRAESASCRREIEEREDADGSLMTLFVAACVVLVAAFVVFGRA